jgi:hypothetical protein
MVDPGGFEPPTSSMPSRRAANCATAPPGAYLYFYSVLQPAFIASGGLPVKLGLSSIANRENTRENGLSFRYRLIESRGKQLHASGV